MKEGSKGTRKVFLSLGSFASLGVCVLRGWGELWKIPFQKREEHLVLQQYFTAAEFLGYSNVKWGKRRELVGDEAQPNPMLKF